MRRATIRSVADEAGVSITTVSNVINGRHQQMAPETLDRVLSAMERLGYRPNRVAQSLVTNRTATIGLIMGEVTNALYPPVTIGAEAACRAAGYSLLLANADGIDTERRLVEVMRAKQVDGLVLFSVSFLDVANDHLLRAQAEGTPVVAINRHLPDGAPLSTVWFDHHGGGYQATQHLIALGHRRIAHVAGPAHRFTGQQRRRGYEKALREARIPLDPSLIAEGDYSFESGEILMERLWAERPTAVFVGGDAMALGALRALARLGVRVPADLSLVAFGNPDCVRYATPAISTIDLPVAAAGRTAVELVLHRLADRDGAPAETEVRILDTALLVRETTAPPP
ncbi:MAG TPA: LacI family DNA-binding transcriptional regulator [Thermomicrobiales bacterium]